MIVRVDTTNLTRGLSFNIVVQTDEEPEISIYAFNSASHEVVTLDYTMEQSGVFFKASSKAPSFDGYLLAKINSKSLIVKKIGHPLDMFVMGYKENYTIHYKMFNQYGEITEDGNLINIIDGFYYCEIPIEITIIETLRKRFILKSNFTKLNYDVILGDGTIDNIDLPNYDLSSTLSDVTLADVDLIDTDINATLADVEIKEY